MHSSPRRSRGRSFGSRRNNRQIQNYVLFVSLLSVFVLFYQQRSFMPAQVSEEKNPNVLFAAESAVKEKEADIKAIKKGEGVAKPNPKKSKKKNKHGVRRKQPPEVANTTTTNISAAENISASFGEENGTLLNATAEVLLNQTLLEDLNETAANFSMSNFYHSDPCNSTLARIATENITFYENETTCTSTNATLPITLAPDTYKLPDLSKLFVHCENWQDSISSSIASADLTEACLSGNSILPVNAKEVLAPINKVVRRFHKRPLSCAVVGSSSQILANPDFGKEIDKHHVVIRLNQAPTNGSCAQYTGSKTTIRILNGRWTYKYTHIDRAAFLPLEKDSLVIISRTSGKDYQRLHQKFKELRPDVDVRMLSREVIGKTKLLLKNYKAQAKDQLNVSFSGGDTPSSGLVALVIALNACSKVSLYGFGILKRTYSKTRFARKFYHYFSHMMGQQHEDEVHSFDAEIALMASLGRHRSTVKFCGINRELNFTAPATATDLVPASA